MANTNDFTRLVPGFDFLQTLMKGAGAGIPGMSQWIAPTINPEELEKRISELKTVQFWLENNARLLATTIQALEVQRMTLSTLQSMNMPLVDLRDALKIGVPAPAAPAPAPAPAPRARADAETDDADDADDAEEGEENEAEAPAPSRKKASERTSTATGGKAGAPPIVDPMQWWGALTQQFTELASKALKDGAGDAGRTLAGAAVKQAATAAGSTLASAAALPAQAAVRRGTRAAAKKRSR